MTILFAAALLFLSVTGASAAFDQTGWTWERPVEVQGAPGFVRLPIPPEVFDESKATLDDLRVLDDNNALVPHVFHWGRVHEVQELEWRSARLLNPTYLPGRYARVILDFGQIVEKNRVMVSLSGENYRRRALLEGSNDSRSWEVVAEDLWLFEVSFQGQHFKVDALKFPPNNFRYLRLTVYNMSDDPRRITIESVKAAFSRLEGDKELVPVPVKSMTVSQDDTVNQSRVELDLGFRNLPVVSLHLVVGSPYFYRAYELVGRNQAVEKVPRKTETGWDTVQRKVPWASVQRGVVYRTKHREKVAESLIVESFHAPYRFLQLRIFNGDNPPIQLDGVTLFRRDTSLVFEASPGRTYRLIGGNAKARAASYDLARAIHGVDELKVPAVRLGPSLPMKQTEPLRPWSERHGAIIWVALILAVMVMLLLIVRSLKSLRATRQG
jgi:hypothetical protein